MSWLIVVLAGHFLNAVAFVIDKILLTKSFQNPFVYAFFIGVLGGLAVVLLPFGVQLTTGTELLVDIAGGVLFIVSLLFFFTALKGSEASRIVPFIGGGIPVFTLIFELLFIDSSFSAKELLAFAILVVGTVLIAIEIGPKKDESKKTLGARAWVYGLLAAVSFATSFGLTKIAYDAQPFVSAFFWQRAASFVFVLLFLLLPVYRKAIKHDFPMLKTRVGATFMLSQSFGGGGFVLINYAISLASVSIVNALQGVQYAFLLIMAVLGTLKWPNLLKESMNRTTLVLKSIAVVVIGVGLYLIAAIG